MKRSPLQKLIRTCSAVTALFLVACAGVGGTGTRLPATVEYVRPAQVVDSAELPAQRDVLGSYLTARIAEARGDYLQAADAYLAVAMRDVSQINMAERAFSLFLIEGDTDGASEAAALLIEHTDLVPLVAMFRAYELAIAGEYVEAEKVMAKLLKEPTELLHLHMAHSYLRMAAGEPVDKVITDVEKLKPGPGMAVYKYYNLGRLYARAENLEKAITNYQKAFQLDPGSIMVVLGLGNLYAQNGDVEKVKELYASFMKLHPDSLLLDEVQERLKRGEPLMQTQPDITHDLADVSFGLASILAGQGIDNTASQFLTLTLMMRPQHSLALFSRGLLADKMMERTQALSFYRQVRPSSVAGLAARLRVAEVDFAQGDQRRALRQMRAMVQAYPERMILRKAYAKSLFEAEDFRNAVAQMDVILKGVEKPTREEAAYFFLRGAAHERLRNLEQATTDMQKVLEIDPDNPLVLNYLGYMWVDQNINLPEAYEMLSRAVALRPYDGAIVDSLGWAYFRKGKFEQALEHLERAAMLQPEDGTILGHLGYAYDAVGRHDEARAYWRRALELGVDSTEDERDIRRRLRSR